MKKIITILILSLLIAAVPAQCIAGSSDINTADALNELGLFLGTGNGYELENNLTRAQGITLLVRMLGKEKAAKNGVYNIPFIDVPDWAAGYVGYAYENGITDGTGETTFSPDMPMTDYMFLTLVMRALNYRDKGDEPLFVWNKPYARAYELKLIKAAEADTDFTRADAVSIFWNALDTKLNGTELTLAHRLIEQGIFSAEDFDKAKDIQKNRRRENAGVPMNPDITPESDPPVTEAPEIEPPVTDAPVAEAPEIEPPVTDAPVAEAPKVEPTATDTTVAEAPKVEPTATDTTDTEQNEDIEIGEGGLPFVPFA